MKIEDKGAPFKLQEYNFEELTGSGRNVINSKLNDPKARMEAIRKNKKC